MQGFMDRNMRMGSMYVVGNCFLAYDSLRIVFLDVEICNVGHLIYFLFWLVQQWSWMISGFSLERLEERETKDHRKGIRSFVLEKQSCIIISRNFGPFRCGCKLIRGVAMAGVHE